MRRFLFSPSVLSAVFSGWGTVKATREGPRDWRLVLTWVIWACTLAIAIGTVAKQSAAIRDRLEH